MQLAYRALAHYLTADPERVDRLIAYAQRHPYSHLGDYMGRWWVFNPYEDAEGASFDRNWFMDRVVPSVRIHHIRRPDADRHLHNHPWNAQRIVLRGGYVEELELVSYRGRRAGDHLPESEKGVPQRFKRLLIEGDTAPLKAGEFHRITRVSKGGAWTLFITGRYRQPWGFKLDDGTFVPRREYAAAMRGM